jgi:hypothetical protein
LVAAVSLACLIFARRVRSVTRLRMKNSDHADGSVVREKIFEFPHETGHKSGSRGKELNSE